MLLADIFLLMPVIFVLIGIFLIIFWVIMFLDVLKNRKINDTNRLIWGIGMLVLPPLALLYFFVAYSGNK